MAETTINKWQIYCNDESAWISGWLENRPTVCFNNNTHSVNALSAQLLEDHAQIGNSGSSVSVSGSTAMTPFGSLKVESYHPIFQYEFPYTLNHEEFNLGITGGGGASVSNALLIVESGTTSALSQCHVDTRRRAKYRPGQGIIARFTTIFTPGTTDTIQYAGIIDDRDGFAIGYNGTSLGLLHRNSASGTTIDTWIPNSNWSVDPADGTGDLLPLIDFTKGNVMEISFQYLGMGMICFKIENPSTGNFTLLHQIPYANKNIYPSLSQATLPFRMFVDNGLTTNDMKVCSSSVGIFNEGSYIKASQIIDSVNVLVESLSSQETVFFSIRNRDLYGGVPNHVEVFLEQLSVSASSNGNRIVVIQMYMNSVLSGSSWTFVQENDRVLEQDLVGTITTPGILLFKTSISNNTTEIFNLEHYNAILTQNDVITVTGYTSNGSADVALSMVVVEDH